MGQRKQGERMNRNPQPYTTVHALQAGYELALRDLDPHVDNLIRLATETLDHVDNDNAYHYTKDELEHAVRTYRQVRRRIAVEMGLDDHDSAP